MLELIYRKEGVFMKIEIWSDYVCPFCYIGKRRLESALQNFPHRNEVEVVFKSYELDPNASKDGKQPVIENLAQKYGTSIEQAKMMVANVEEQAKTVGLNLNFSKMVHTNTFNAHRLAKFAETKGVGDELTEKLLNAYFVQAKNIGSDEVLTSLGEEVGLNKEEIKQVLQSDQFQEAVRKEQLEARQLQVQGVPFFVINRKYAISGAQPESLFLNTLQKIWEEENNVSPLQTITNEEAPGASCTDEGCEIPPKKDS